MKIKFKIAIIVITVIIIASTIFYFFKKSNYKTIEFGNTNNKSAEEIKEYILNISSYDADISLEVTSNKTTNKYRLKQKYVKPNIFKQEMIEPDNISGLTTIYDGKSLKIENTNLKLSEVYENYQYISENSLCLYNFIEDYKMNNNVKFEEKEDMIIMQVKVDNSSNKYVAYKRLYISKKTAKPVKMEIQDMNQKMLVYIQYNEIKINSTSKDEILAFKLNMQNKDI